MPRKKTQIDECPPVSSDNGETYLNLFNNAAVAMFQSRIDGSRILNVNNKFCDLFGVVREEAVGKPASNFWAVPEEREEMLGRLKRDGKVIDFECHLLGKDDQILTCLISVILYPEQGTLAGSLIDITERERIVKEALEAKEHYEQLVNNLQVGVYRNTPGPEGHFVEANPAIVGMFEADSKEEFLKHNVCDLYQDPAKREEFSKKMLAQGFLKSEELYLKTLKGNMLWGSVTSVMKKDEQGNVFFDGIVEDVTERKKAEKEISNRNRELEMINRLMVDRELKMIELKKENEKLKNKLGSI